jgi:hypothetical protein
MSRVKRLGEVLDFDFGFAWTGFPVRGSFRTNAFEVVVCAVAVETVAPAMITVVAMSVRIFIVKHHPERQTDSSHIEAGLPRLDPALVPHRPIIRHLRPLCKPDEP